MDNESQCPHHSSQGSLTLECVYCCPPSLLYYTYNWPPRVSKYCASTTELLNLLTSLSRFSFQKYLTFQLFQVLFSHGSSSLSALVKAVTQYPTLPIPLVPYAFSIWPTFCIVSLFPLDFKTPEYIDFFF
jgi:hypothetical protein